MSAQHTQGRLYIRTNRHPNTDGTPWGWVDLYEPGSMRQASPDGIQVTWSSGQKSEANARRLVACWNACEGIDTEALEQMEGSDSQLATAARILNVQLLRQRDELLAAARLTLTTFNVLGRSIPTDVGAALVAAIAKVEGGAA